jgi:hypothetical protein
MKIKATSILAGSAAVIFLANQSVRADDLFAVAEVASKITGGPVMATPHGLEEFQWLTRSSTAPMRAGERSKWVPESVKNNRALANSPRVLEKYPVLARTEQRARAGESIELTRVRQNAALSASPREREEFPSLLRQVSAEKMNNVFSVVPPGQNGLQ